MSRWVEEFTVFSSQQEAEEDLGHTFGGNDKTNSSFKLTDYFCVEPFKKVLPERGVFFYYIGEKWGMMEAAGCVGP